MKKLSLKSRFMLLMVAMMTLSLTQVFAAETKSYAALFTIKSADVVTNSTYSKYETTVAQRDWIITFGGNNVSVGTNSGNRSKCKLGKTYAKYAVSPVDTSMTASAFVCKTSVSDVEKISYTFNGGSNPTATKVYLIYSADGTTFSQMELTSGTQGADISSGTAYTFAKKTGYFGLLFKATGTGNWRIDNVEITFYAEPDMHDMLYFTSKKTNGTGTVQLNKKASIETLADVTATFEYSTDRKTWTEYTWGDWISSVATGAAIALNQGDTVFFRAKGTKGKNATMGYSMNAYFRFAFGADDSIAVGGNVMSLYDATCEQDTMTEGGFYNLFSTNPSLVSVSELKLPAKKLAKDCYYTMFEKCTSLTTAPELPSTALAPYCYNGMFKDCSALTQAPELNATTLAYQCCYQMFQNCTALTVAPALPATKMAERCYACMFEGCTSLTAAPELKADSMANLCYYKMFSGCTSLQVDTCADGNCDGAKLEPTHSGTGEPTSWSKKMFDGCHVNDSVKLGGHYCIKEYIAPYTRNVTKGNYGTICLDKKFNTMEGVEGLYVPASKDTKVLYCSEVKLSDVVAGGAYIFKADSSVVVFHLEGEAVSAAVNNDHMIGWLAADSVLNATFVSDHSGYALLASNQIVSPQSGSTIKQNRAFIDLVNVSDGSAPSAAGRYIALGINEATGLDEMHGQRPNAQMQNAECKMLVNGQLIIIKDGVKYNAMGQKME